jgi:hypothetical protein
MRKFKSWRQIPSSLLNQAFFVPISSVSDLVDHQARANCVPEELSYLDAS